MSINPETDLNLDELFQPSWAKGSDSKNPYAKYEPRERPDRGIVDIKDIGQLTALAHGLTKRVGLVGMVCFQAGAGIAAELGTMRVQEELAAIEQQVNEAIAAAAPVQTEVLSLDEAKAPNDDAEPDSTADVKTAPPDDARPSVLLGTRDTTRADALGEGWTPNLGALAEHEGQVPLGTTAALRLAGDAPGEGGQARSEGSGHHDQPQ